MVRRVTDPPIFDERDGELLDTLARAKLLSTSQLQRIVGRGEPLGVLAERLGKLTRAGWLKCLPRVAGPSGLVTAWHRADLTGDATAMPLAIELLHLNELYAALVGGPRQLAWTVELGEKPEALLEAPGHGGWRLAWAADRSDTPSALALGSLVLCADPELREALENDGIRAATLDEGIHVLRALIHGEELVAPAGEPVTLELTDADRAEIAAFLEDQL